VVAARFWRIPVHPNTAVLLLTEPVAAVLGLIAYSSSTTLTMVESLTVVALTPRLSMWASTGIHGWPNLCASRVAAAFGYCRDMVYRHRGVHRTSRYYGESDRPHRHAGRTPARPHLKIGMPAFIWMAQYGASHTANLAEEAGITTRRHEGSGHPSASVNVALTCSG
jgi:hypothetical protein